MLYFRLALVIVIMNSVSLLSFAQQRININYESIDNHKLKWWKDAHFGMFIHWGLYSLAAGEWDGEVMKGNGYAEQINLNMKIPNAEYELLASKFNPMNFDADEWIDYAVKAGMKYIIITAKHQDGFAMFHSKVSDYNIVDATPFKRDPLSELAIASRKAGIRVGFYYSNARDYHVAGANWNTYGNIWDFPVQTEDDFKKYYYGLVFDQVKELLTNYGKIDVMWFDVPYKITEQMSKDLKAHVLALQPDCIINGRIGNNMGDYLSMGDNAIPDKPLEYPWEACATMNNTWGYSKKDNNWKDSKQLLTLLIESVSKGGNFLLNVGPTGLGSFDESASRILFDIGTWMKINRRSIYNCTQSPDDFKVPDNCLMTYNPATKHLYIHLIEYSSQNLKLKGCKGTIKSARFLQDSLEIKMKPIVFVRNELKSSEEEYELKLILPENKLKIDIPVIELVLN